MTAPSKHWIPLPEGGYLIPWNGMSWTLTRTPRSRYPWVLTSRDGQTQEIGEPGDADAQAKAELWLDLSRFPYPPMTILRAS